MTAPLSVGFCVVILAFGADTSAARQVDVPRSLTLTDIHDSQKFDGKFFAGGRWAAEGPVIRYTESDEEDGGTNLLSYNLETDERHVLIDGSILFGIDVDRLVAIENYAFSADNTKVLIYTDSERVWRLPTKGFYYIYEFESGDLTPLSDRSQGFQMFAKFSPDGNSVAFVRERNLFVVDLESMTEKALTTDGADGSIINGTFDWVYEEEFGLRDGWQWSPDGRFISYFKLDESATRDFAMTDLRGQYPDYDHFRYPKAGESNSEIQIGIIDVGTGVSQFIDTDTWHEGGDQYEYISRMGWTPLTDGQQWVWMIRLNRYQNNLDLLFGDPESATPSIILTEKESSWISVGESKITFLKDGNHFVWMSETSGFNHLYLYDLNGNQISAITAGEWDVTAFHGIDEENQLAYFTAAINNPLERQLYSISIETEAGDEGATTSHPVRVTDKAGSHSVNLSSDFSHFIDSYSNTTSPRSWTLHRSNGVQIKVLEGNRALKKELSEYNLPEPQFFTVPSADGTSLNAYLMKPSDFDSEKSYPLLMYVYGGPGSQTVRDTWGDSRYLWHAYLVEELDILIASVDNRGTGARGKKFKSMTYERLGQVEAADQIAAAKHLGSLPYVDGDRIGIWGWSYGGYITLMSMLTGEGPDVFKVGVSVAPVTDWRLYDTIYTERYMSTPEKNKAGYGEGAAINYAKNLSERQKLLIIHGDYDDNVHFQNSVQMIDALQAANKPFSFMMYPGRNHGISGGKTRLHLFTAVTEFIKENL